MASAADDDRVSKIKYWPHFGKFGLVRIKSGAGIEPNYNVETSEQRKQDVDTIDYNARIDDGWYNEGVAIRLGKTIGGRYGYGVAADLDGQDAVLAWFGSWENVVNYAKNNRVEWHKDQWRLHLLFYTDKPVRNSTIHISPGNQIEIKCEGMLLRVSNPLSSDHILHAYQTGL